MRIAIEVAGFSAGQIGRLPARHGHLALRSARWRSSTRGFVEGCMAASGLTAEQAEELFRQVAGVRQLRLQQEPRRGLRAHRLRVGLPEAVLPGPVHGRADQRAADGLLPGRGAHQRRQAAWRGGAAGGHQCRSRYRTATEWVGMPGAATPQDAGIDRRPEVVRSPACVVLERRERGWLARRTHARRLRHPPRPAPRQRHRRGARGQRMDAEVGARAVSLLADVVARTGSRRRSVERLIRAGGLDSLGRPRRELLWQLHGGRRCDSRSTDRRSRCVPTLDLRLPATEAPDLPPPSELERLGDEATPSSRSDARRQVIELFRPALAGLGAVTAGRDGGAAAGSGRHRRAGRDPAAPDDRQGDRLPGRRRRERAWSASRSGQTPGLDCEASSAVTRCCTSKARSSARRTWSTWWHGRS